MAEPFTLNLTTSSISNPTRLDQWEIEAAMLWPEDERAREVSVRAAMTEYGVDHLPELGPEQLGHVRDHLKAGAPRIADLRPEVEERVWHGSITGLLTLRSSVGAELFGAKPLGEQQRELSERLWRTFKIAPKTMQQKDGPVTKFRPVAHLWAAFVMYAANGRESFPCRVVDIPDFIATAESIRVKAEATRLPRSDFTVMREGEAVRLPADVVSALPPVQFKLRTFPETVQ